MRKLINKLETKAKKLILNKIKIDDITSIENIDIFFNDVFDATTFNDGSKKSKELIKGVELESIEFIYDYFDDIGQEVVRIYHPITIVNHLMDIVLITLKKVIGDHKNISDILEILENVSVYDVD